MDFSERSIMSHPSQRGRWGRNGSGFLYRRTPQTHGVGEVPVPDEPRHVNIIRLLLLVRPLPAPLLFSLPKPI